MEEGFREAHRSIMSNLFSLIKMFCRMDGHTNGTNGSCSKPCEPLTDYCIPDYILNPDSEQVLVDQAPCCPVVVFINSRSGGQLGSSLIKTYRELLNKAQVPNLVVWEDGMLKRFPWAIVGLHIILSYYLIFGSTIFTGFWFIRRGSWKGASQIVLQLWEAQV